jgi:hypothetical protein
VDQGSDRLLHMGGVPPTSFCGLCGLLEVVAGTAGVIVAYIWGASTQPLSLWALWAFGGGRGDRGCDRRLYMGGVHPTSISVGFVGFWRWSRGPRA